MIKVLNNKYFVISVYRWMQHDCNHDERHNRLDVNMFKVQNETKNQEPQIIVIKSPKNIRRCRNPNYQWRFYNLSPNFCKFNIDCKKFIGGDCGKGDYILQLFFVDHWSRDFTVFHSDKEEKENEKICRKNEVHHRIVKNNQMLVINLVFLIDALDLEEDSGFSCRVEYDCRKPNTNIPVIAKVPSSSVTPTRKPPITISSNISLSTTTITSNVVSSTTETALQLATSSIDSNSSK